MAAIVNLVTPLFGLILLGTAAARFLRRNGGGAEGLAWLGSAPRQRS